MNPNLALFLSLTIYKLATLLSGVFLCYLGYRLFISGVWGRTGDMDAQFRDSRLILKKAAPGTFFTVLGAIVIIVSVWKGMNLQTTQDGIEDANTRATTSGDASPMISTSGGSIKIHSERKETKGGGVR